MNNEPINFDIRDENDKHEDVQYLSKLHVGPADVPSPIQGPVYDEAPLIQFVCDSHDESKHKFFAIYLDEEYFTIGIETIAIGEDALPQNIRTRSIFRHDIALLAAHIVVVCYRVGHHDDPAPTREDKKLIYELHEVARLLRDSHLENYIIIAGDHWWSIRQQYKGQCKCGKVHH